VPCGGEPSLFASFLGTIAKNNTLTPLSIEHWKRREFKPFHRQILKSPRVPLVLLLHQWDLELRDQMLYEAFWKWSMVKNT
ncbi:unnamed protein product, partial [Linum tenue]